MMRLQNALVAAALAFLWLGLSSSAGAAEFPEGTFTVTDSGGAAWAVSFDGKGKVTVTRAGKQVVEGTARPLYIYADRADRTGDASASA